MMVNFSKILHYVEDWLGEWCIQPSLELIGWVVYSTISRPDISYLADKLTQYMSALTLFIWMQFIICYDTLRHFLVKGYYFLLPICLISLPLLMQIGEVALTLHSLVMHWFHGNQRNNPQFQNLLQKLIIELYLLSLVKLFASNGCSFILTFILTLPWYFVTANLLFIL